MNWACYVDRLIGLATVFAIWGILPIAFWLWVEIVVRVFAGRMWVLAIGTVLILMLGVPLAACLWGLR